MAMLTMLSNLNRTGIPYWGWIVSGVLLLVMLAFPLVGAWNRIQTRRRLKSMVPVEAVENNSASTAEILGTTGAMAGQQPGIYY